MSDGDLRIPRPESWECQYRPNMATKVTTTSIVATVQIREALKLVCGRNDSFIRNVVQYNGLRNS